MRVSISLLLVIAMLLPATARSQNAVGQSPSPLCAADEIPGGGDERQALVQLCAMRGLQRQASGSLSPLQSSALCSTGSESDTHPCPPPWYDIVGRDAMAFWRAAVHVGTAPTRWDGRDLIRATAIVGVTGMAAFADEEARKSAMRNHSASVDGVESAVRLYGEAWLLTAVAGGAYGTGLVFENEWLRETAFLAGTSLILTTAATRILKIIIGRGRPYYTTDPQTFRMFSLADAYNSFPSGHSVAAFSVSTVLAYRIDNVWATVGLYGLATMTALSRVYADEHWFSDVVFGALFSTALSRSVISWYEHDRGGTTDGGFRMLPTPNGITLIFQF